MSVYQDQCQSAFPNKISRILLLAVRDVVGENASDAVLTTARLSYLIDAVPPSDFGEGLTFAEVGRLFEAIDEIYGVTGGSQVAHDAGRASFRYWAEGLGGLMAFADVIFRILPLSMRAKIGVEALAEIFNRYSGQKVTLDENSESYFFVLERCGFCCGRRTDRPSCAFAVGILEELLFWVSLGRNFIVEETTCTARGDPVCTFCITKTPTESLGS